MHPSVTGETLHRSASSNGWEDTPMTRAALVRASAFLTVLAAALSSPAPRAAGGQKLLFSSNRDGKYRLYLADPDTGAAERVPGAPEGATLPAWSPDGKRVA